MIKKSMFLLLVVQVLSVYSGSAIDFVVIPHEVVKQDSSNGCLYKLLIPRTVKSEGFRGTLRVPESFKFLERLISTLAFDVTPGVFKDLPDSCRTPEARARVDAILEATRFPGMPAERAITRLPEGFWVVDRSGKEFFFMPAKWVSTETFKERVASLRLAFAQISPVAGYEVIQVQIDKTFSKVELPPLPFARGLRRFVDQVDTSFWEQITKTTNKTIIVGDKTFGWECSEDISEAVAEGERFLTSLMSSVEEVGGAGAGSASQ